MSTDSERMDWLEKQTVGNNYHDTLLQWDHEDGVWVARCEKGTLGAMPLDPRAFNETLREAIDAAMESEARRRARL